MAFANGFFSKLGDIWSDWTDFDDHWESSKKAFGQGVDAVVSGAKNIWAGTISLALTPFKGSDEWDDAKESYKQFGGDLLKAGGSFLQSAFELPVLNETAHTVLWAQNEAVKRPLGTFQLRLGDALRADDASKFFDGGAWRQSYNDTRRVSMGQAWTYAAGQGLGFDAPDPRTAAGQSVYTSKEWNRYKITSGTADAVVDIFADPTVFAAKGVKAAKVATISKPFTAKALDSGAVDRYVTSQRFDEVFDLAQKQPLPEFQRTVYAGKDSAAASAFHLAANITDPVLARATAMDTVLSSAGDTRALGRLRDNAPSIAQAVAVSHASEAIRDVANGVVTNPRLYDGALAGDRTASLADDLTAGLEAGIRGDVESLWTRNFRSMANEYQPRVSVTGQWRNGIHRSLATGKPVRMMAGFALRDLLPSGRYSRQLALGTAQSSEDFAWNAERWSHMPAARRTELVSEYTRASNPQARRRIAETFEEEAFTHTALAYGFTAGEARAMIPMINARRTASTTVFNQNRRYVATDIREAAERARSLDRPDEAQALSTHLQMHQNAVQAGQAPAEYVHVLDMDGNPVRLATEWKMPTATDPALTTSNASEIVPMMDARVLEGALWWANGGGRTARVTAGLGQSSYRAMHAAMGLVDAVNYVWKVSTLMRPGYIWRVLSDEVLRRIAVFGSAPFIESSVTGLVNTGHNMAARAGIGFDLAFRRGELRAQRAALPVPSTVQAPTTRVRADALSSGLARVAPDGTRNYANLTDMFADGGIGISEYADLAVRLAGRHPLPAEVATAVGRYRLGRAGYGRAELERDIADYALWRTGRAAYRAPVWQQSVIDAAYGGRPRSGNPVTRPVLEGRVERAGQVRNRVTPSRGTMTPPVVLADPLTGRTFNRHQLGEFDVSNSVRVPNRFAPERGRTPADALYQYIHKNMSRLTRPDTVVMVTVDNADNLVFSLAQSRTKQLVEGAPQRVTLFGKEGVTPRFYRDAGSRSPLTMQLSDGTTMRVGGAFEGDEGRMFRALASSRGQGGSYSDFLSKVEYERLLNTHGSRLKTFEYGTPEYAANWERTVNAELAADPAARMLLAGRNTEDVLAWIRTTKEGRAYAQRMGHMQPRYVEQVYTIASMVDKYAPVYRGRAAEGFALREKILARTATVDDLVEAAGHTNRMPAVIGAEADVAFGGGAIGWMQNVVNGVFKRMSDLPADKASRFPFFNEAYRRHMNDLSAVAAVEARRNPKYLIDTDEVYKMQTQARERALADVRTYLYDVSSTLDFARASRLVFPFGSAIADSYQKWGRIIREKPQVGLNLWKAYTAPDRAGLVEDENGAHLRWENGKRVWYIENPQTGEETRLGEDYAPASESIRVQLPEGFGPLPEGMRYSTKISKDSLNTFLALATTGPIVSVPASEFALKNPEFGDSWAVRKFVLPFGPSHDPYRVMVPGTVRTTWEAFTEQDSDEASGQALAIWQAEQVEYAQGRRAAPPTFKEAREKAASMRQLRFLLYMGGISGQIQTPYQPYADYYRSLQSKTRTADDPTVDEEFYDTMGEEFFAFTAKVSQNRLGLPADIESNKRWKNVRDLTATYPEIARWIVGAEGAGEFSRSVYEAQYRQTVSEGSSEKIRRKLSLEESVQDVQRRQGWLEYSRMQDRIDEELAARGLTSLTQKGAEDLAADKKAWTAARMFWTDPNGNRDVSPWYEDYKSTDMSKTLRVMQGMYEVAQDPRMQNRSDIQGFLDYLREREEVRYEMRMQGAATLKNKKVAYLKDAWEQSVFELRSSNLAFADLYNRFLERDDLSTDLSGVLNDGADEESATVGG